VALPENFAIMGMKDTDKVNVRESSPARGRSRNFSPPRRKTRHLADRRLGADWSAATRKVRNSCLVYDDKGKQVARYDKIHLFGLDLGNEHYKDRPPSKPAIEVVVVESPFGRIGLSICYDLRFPELYRAMGDVDIILVPAAFTATTGKAHFETLIRARAIENLAYVIAPAQGGYHSPDAKPTATA
jgi:predicted amidohydrolase